MKGSPYPVREALRGGVPVVATDVVGPRALMVHGETGIWFPPCRPTAIAEGLVELLADRVRTCAMANASRRRFSELHAVDLMASQIAALYADVTG